MRKKIVSAALALMTLLVANAASPSGIFPNPQQETVGSTAFAANGTTFKITGASTADADAVAALNRNLTVAESGSVEIVIGKAGDNAVASVAANIPDNIQGYYLKVEPGKVTIAGRDDLGTYYGVQSFLQLVDMGNVPSIEVKDWPSIAVRGVVEGYYGNPWTHEDCMDMCKFFDRVKMNTFIYGPKNDEYHHGSGVFSPYPTVQAQQLATLVTEANAHKIDIVWAMHPGNATGEGDRTRAKTKLEAMYNLGFRRFAVFFDDIFDKKVNEEVAFVNYLNREFVQKKSDVKSLIVCPEEYCNSFTTDNGIYIATMGAGLDSDIDILWTGSAVVDMELATSCDWFINKAGRKPFIWHNYPCSDYGSRPLLLCPYEAAAMNLPSKITGFTSNPMEYYEASKVGVYGMSDYAWNPEAYNDWEAWEEAVEYMFPDNSDAFRTYCLSNFNYPAPKSHGKPIIYTETPDFKALIDSKPLSAATVSDYKTYFNKQINAASELLGLTDNRLVIELKEWIQYYDLQSRRGLMIAEMQQALDEKNSDAFIAAYTSYDSHTKTAAELRSHDFPGTLRVLTPFCGSQFVEPFITRNVDRLVDEYKDLGLEYPSDLFPERIIENGLYHILYNGRYLHNFANQGTPGFTTTPDNVNPNRDVWKITYDSQVGRYAIRSAEDDRYVNELGNFGTNEFLSSWNTYHIVPLGNLWSIQNDGSAGTKFWTCNGTRISQGSTNELKTSNYIFQIVPAGEPIPPTPSKAFADGDYVIKDKDGNYLTRNTSNHALTFSPRIGDNGVAASQTWQITLDSSTDRFKIAQGSYHINEKGEIGVGGYGYLATWNSYVLRGRLDDMFSIQNGGLSGDKYWGISNGKIRIVDDAGLVQNMVFNIVSLATEEYLLGIDEVSADIPADSAVYDLQGRRVAKPSNGIYIQKGKKIFVK